MRIVQKLGQFRVGFGVLHQAVYQGRPDRMASNQNRNSKLPMPSGPFTVGCTDIITGIDLEGSFFRLFYPSSLSNINEHVASWPSWIPHPKYVEGYASVFGIMPMIGKRLITWALGSCYVPNVIDAAPSREKPFPVILFSHGLTGCRTAYSVVCSELASHGFIVAAIEHRDESACMTYKLVKASESEEYEKEWISYRAVDFEKDDKSLRLEQLLHRIKECSHVLDFLESINEGNIPNNITHSTIDLNVFMGTMDLSNPAIAGHSFGAATVMRTMAVDKRFRLGVAMDAWMWPLKDETALPDQVEQPILFINMEAFQNVKSLTVMRRFVINQLIERRVVTLRGSVHKNQVDLPFLIPSYLRRLARAQSEIDPHLAMNLNNRLILLFLWKHLGVSVNQDYADYVEAQSHWIYEGIRID